MYDDVRGERDGEYAPREDRESSCDRVFLRVRHGGARVESHVLVEGQHTLVRPFVDRVVGVVEKSHRVETRCERIVRAFLQEAVKMATASATGKKIREQD